MLAQQLMVEKKWRHQCSLAKAVGSTNYTINPSSFLNHVMPPCSSKHKYQGMAFIKSKLLYSPLFSHPHTLDPSSVSVIFWVSGIWTLKVSFRKFRFIYLYICHTTYSTTPLHTSSMTTQICLTHWMIASGVPEIVTARSVEFGSMSPATWTWAPVD